METTKSEKLCMCIYLQFHLPIAQIHHMGYLLLAIDNYLYVYIVSRTKSNHTVVLFYTCSAHVSDNKLLTPLCMNLCLTTM